MVGFMTKDPTDNFARFIYLAAYFGRIAIDERKRRHAVGYDRTGSDHCVFSDRDVWQNSYICSN